MSGIYKGWKNTGKLSLLLIVPIFAFGQNSNLSGRIKDPSGASVAQATISVTSQQQGVQRTTVTNELGEYLVAGLLPGGYSVTVEAKGFARVVQQGVQLEAAQNARLDIALTIESKQEIVVDGGAFRMDTEDGTVSTLVDRKLVDTLPMNGRSLQTLIDLVPGVTLANTNNSEQGQFSVNGQRPDANYFIIDGVSANVGVSPNASPGQSASGALPAMGALGGTNSLVSVDALQEIKVMTSSYQPEFGRTPGGQIALVTRSGTNNIHGILSEYLRNDVFDAADWFVDYNKMPKPPERNNDFGGVVGGPIVKNRTFYFLSYEGLRLRLPQQMTTDVPNTSDRSCAPSALLPYLAMFPKPNAKDTPYSGVCSGTSAGLANYKASFSNPSSLDAFAVRIDQHINGRLNVFGRYDYSPSQIVQRGTFTSTLNTLVGTKFHLNTLTTGATWVLSSRSTNETFFNWSQNNGKGDYTNDTMGGAVLLPDSAFFPSNVDASSALAFFNITGGNDSRIVHGKLTNNTQHQINIVDNFTFVLRSHQLKFGFDYRRMAADFGVRSYLLNAQFAGPAGVMTGLVSSATVGATSGVLTPVSPNYSSFVQDTWRINDRLVATYGVRWEINPAPQGENGQNAAVLMNVDTPASLALAPSGTPLYQTRYDSFAPRLGLAYTLRNTSGKETVLRAGSGLFYDTGSAVAPQAFAGGYPFFRSVAYKKVAFPLTAAQAAPPSLTFTTPYTSVYGYDENFHTPRTFSISAGVEQNLGKGQTAVVTYVGEMGRHLLRTNTLVNPDATFATVYITRSNSTSNYHGLQAQYQRRIAEHWSATAAYTWAHSIDDTSSDDYLDVALNPGSDRASSDYDVRHQLSGALSVLLPKFDQHEVLARSIGHWETDWLFLFRTAAPVNVLTGTDPLGISQTDYARPDLISGTAIWQSCPSCGGGKQINKNAFLTPTGRQGILGRNYLRGFDASQFNMALHRKFKLTERIGLQFRAEAFNVFNHPSFAAPDNTMTDTTFGTSIQMFSHQLSGGTANASGFNTLYQLGSARSLEFALKLDF